MRQTVSIHKEKADRSFEQKSAIRWYRKVLVVYAYMNLLMLPFGVLENASLMISKSATAL